MVRRMVQTARGAGAFAFLVLNTVFWCLPVFALGVVRPLLPKRAGIAVGTLMFRAVDGWVVCARAMVATLGVARVRREIAADAETPVGQPPCRMRSDGWFLVVSNHQSWADIVVLVIAFYGRIPQFKFFTKRDLIWIPFIGLALWLLDFPYVRRYGRERLRADPTLGAIDRDATRRACSGFRERPTSILIFLEGTRFTAAKRLAQESPYQALLRPRVGGFSLVAEELADRLDAVVDVTITYPGGAPGFWNFLCGRCPTITLRARTLPPPALADREAARRWVDRLWAEKDRELVAG